ncbi:hypothetical protein BD626DRAFT_549146 [Schizophyllum amplum]|uniref:Histone deacetylation protein Rxt3-domain-containing protein n=1 Tax=Schizophyllum amplum TaxID=97359 RepID=A0A550C9U4_9AGAR|nr:hypothetical protein BD626DRAFT_549146 [Auriculariopsis ampla]
MNVADLLQESPSGDKARRQTQNRERDRDARDQPPPHAPDRQPAPDQQPPPRDSWNKYDRFAGERRDKWPPPIMSGGGDGYGYRGMRETAGPGWPPDYHTHPSHASAPPGPAPMYPPSMLGPGAVQGQRPLPIGLSSSPGASSGPMLSGYADPSPFHGASAPSITGPGQPPGPPPPPVSGPSSQAPRRSQTLQGPAQPQRSPAMNTLRSEMQIGPGWGPGSGRPPMSAAEMMDQERERERERSRLLQMEWERDRDRERRKAMKPADDPYKHPPPARRDSNPNINPNLNPSALKDDDGQRDAEVEMRTRHIQPQQLRPSREQVQGELVVLHPHAPATQTMAPPPGMIGYGHHDMRERDRDRERLGLPPHSGHPNLPPPHHPAQMMYPTPPAPPPGQYAQMNRGDPLRPFQNQFHTGWVQEEPVSLSGSPQPLGRERELRERERERDRDRDRRKSKSGKPREFHERDRDRERRERRSELMNMMYEPPVYNDPYAERGAREMYPEKIALEQGAFVVEWEREKEVCAKATIDLGIHVYPRIPFPYFFDIAPGTAKPEEADEKRAEADTAPVEAVEVDTETRTTVLIPAAHLPSERPPRPRVWGGGLVPPPGYEESRRRRRSRDQESDTRGRRRIYTDDSDLFTCAVHAGWTTWSAGRRARLEGWDMRVELRVLRCASSCANGAVGGGGKEELVGRFVGGLGERYHGARPEEWPEEDSDDDEQDDGTAMTSAGWGTGHDGSAIELLKVEFVKGISHSLGLKNRDQRIAEYSERNVALSSPSASPPRGGIRSRKLRRAWPGALPNAIPIIPLLQLEESLQREHLRPPSILDLDVDRRVMEVRTVKLAYGKENKGLCAGYKYDPDTLKSVLFPHRSAERPTKRRRLDDDDMNPDVMMDQPALSADGEEGGDEARRPIILESAHERYLLTPTKQDSYSLSLVGEGTAKTGVNGSSGDVPSTLEDEAPMAEAAGSPKEPGEVEEEPTPVVNGAGSNGEPKLEDAGSASAEPRSRRIGKRKGVARKEPLRYALPPAQRVADNLDVDAFKFSEGGLECGEKAIRIVAWKYVPVEAL